MKYKKKNGCGVNSEDLKFRVGTCFAVKNSF